MKVETEIGQRRYGGHLHLLDVAIGLERESYKGVRFQASVASAGNEGVVLPVLEVPN